MQYKELNDNELVYLCNDNNEEAINIMIDKYKPTILSILKEVQTKYNIIGFEIADLYQEGLLGFMEAIKTFNERKDTTFYTYASVCVRNSIMSSMRSSFRQKNKALNTSCSLDNLLNDSKETYYNILEDNSYEPFNLIVGSEEEEDRINKLNNKLSNSEKEIFALRLKGLKNSEIADLLNKDKKTIENAINRIIKKNKELKDKK